MDSKTSLDKSQYVIPAIDAEKQRLIKQYALKKSIYGWEEAIPNTIDITHARHILDVAAGTCVWTFDFANLNAVKSRLRTIEDSQEMLPIRLYACDIETKFFPDKASLDALGIETFQQDVTKPFPQELCGKFDLVHISFLVIALTKAGWKEALKNCFEVLAPGGALLIDEADPILYAEPPQEGALGHDLTRCMDGRSWIEKANCIYTGWALKKEFIVDLSCVLKSMLEEVGFRVDESRRGLAAHGKMCRKCTGAGGARLDEYEEFSADNMTFILNHLSSALLQDHSMEVPKGKMITTEDERKALLQEIEEGLRREGAVSVGIYCIGRKPE